MGKTDKRKGAKGVSRKEIIHPPLPHHCLSLVSTCVIGGVPPKSLFISSVYRGSWGYVDPQIRRVWAQNSQKDGKVHVDVAGNAGQWLQRFLENIMNVYSQTVMISEYQNMYTHKVTRHIGASVSKITWVVDMWAVNKFVLFCSVPFRISR